LQWHDSVPEQRVIVGKSGSGSGSGSNSNSKYKSSCIIIDSGAVNKQQK
jgi:hypothetical protein